MTVLRARILAAAGVVLIATAAGFWWLRERTPADPAAAILQGAQVDADVRAILMRSCGDCHSDFTRYPWYSIVPVVSGVIQKDIDSGREQLNLSHWERYSRLRRQRSLTGIANQVKDRLMPLPSYLLLHPSATLSDSEIEAVFEWAQKERLRLILEATQHQP